METQRLVWIKAHCRNCAHRPKYLDTGIGDSVKKGKRPLLARSCRPELSRFRLLLIPVQRKTEWHRTFAASLSTDGLGVFNLRFGREAIFPP